MVDLHTKKKNICLFKALCERLVFLEGYFEHKSQIRAQKYGSVRVRLESQVDLESATDRLQYKTEKIMYLQSSTF